MDREHTRSLLEQVAAGTLTVDEAVELFFRDLAHHIPGIEFDAVEEL